MPRKGGSSKPNKAIQAKIKAKFGKASSQTGGRGSVRRKFKAPPKSSLQDDKRLQLQLKKLNVNPIPAIEEVNLFKDDNTVVHFTKPKVQAEIASNTYVISGQCETKKLEELIPAILPQLGREHIDSLKDFAKTYVGAQEDDDDEVPVLVDDNFEQVASSDIKNENEKTDGDNENNDDATAELDDTGDANDNDNDNDNDNANADANADGNADGGDDADDANDANDANDAAPTEDTGADKGDEKQDKNTENNENTADNENADAAAASGADDADKDKETLKPDKDQEVSV